MVEGEGFQKARIGLGLVGGVLRGGHHVPDTKQEGAVVPTAVQPGRRNSQTVGGGAKAPYRGCCRRQDIEAGESAYRSPWWNSRR